MEHPSDQKLIELSEKWLNGSITADELVLLERWYNNPPGENINWTAGDLDEKQLKERLFYTISQNTIANRSRSYFTLKTIHAVAASVIVLLGASIGYLTLKHPTTKEVAVVKKPIVTTDDEFGKAVLTLADGQTMQLDDAANGVIARQGNARVSKTRNGEIVYNSVDADSKEVAVSNNIISTNKGGQYHISLPDGSEVWLNALSALKFPTAFKGSERVVELSGEAYFEVAKNKAMPFRVKMSDETSIVVLGTHFNVMAYPEERSVNATLLEGSISVQKGGINKLVSPGEMAMVTDRVSVQKVNANDVISWKSGLFRFDKADVRTVMREIERWYNVDVVYEGGMPDNEITGFIPRSSQLSEVLKMLEISGLKLKSQGNKIKVFKN